MSDLDFVQRFIPPQGHQLLSMAQTSDDQAGVNIRTLYQTHKAKRPEDLDFTVPLRTIGSFPNTLNWDSRQALENMPRCWRASRRAGRYILIVMGGGGSCLIAEIIDPIDDLTTDTAVRVHPHPIHLPINRSLALDGIHFGFAAGNRKDETNIAICADPGTGPHGTYPPSAPQPGPDISAQQEMTVFNILDDEIIAWGEVFSAARLANQAGQVGWPADLCRHVLLNKDQAVELSSVIKAVGIRAYERFADESANELVVAINAPNRPSPLRPEDDYPWSVFINLRHEMTPGAMRAWIEKTLQSVLATRWPEGFYKVIGPTKTSRLGVQSQLDKAAAHISGPLSNHQKVAAMGVLGSLY